MSLVRILASFVSWLFDHNPGCRRANTAKPWGEELEPKVMLCPGPLAPVIEDTPCGPGLPAFPQPQPAQDPFGSDTPPPFPNPQPAQDPFGSGAQSSGSPRSETALPAALPPAPEAPPGNPQQELSPAVVIQPTVQVVHQSRGAPLRPAQSRLTPSEQDLAADGQIMNDLAVLEVARLAAQSRRTFFPEQPPVRRQEPPLISPVDFAPPVKRTSFFDSTFKSGGGTVKKDEFPIEDKDKRERPQPAVPGVQEGSGTADSPRREVVGRSGGAAGSSGSGATSAPATAPEE